MKKEKNERIGMFEKNSHRVFSWILVKYNKRLDWEHNYIALASKTNSVAYVLTRHLSEFLLSGDSKNPNTQTNKLPCSLFYNSIPDLWNSIVFINRINNVRVYLFKYELRSTHKIQELQPVYFMSLNMLRPRPHEQNVVLCWKCVK